MTEEKKERPLGDKVIRAIVSGRCDPWLDDLISAAVERAKYLRQREAYARLRKMKVGDTVKIVGNIKPKYLAGQTGKVLSLNDTRRRGFPMVEVDLGKSIRRYSPIISVPASCLMVVPEQGEFENVSTL